jgi:hypothetical protein
MHPTRLLLAERQGDVMPWRYKEIINKNIIAAEHSEAAHYSWHTVVSPEFTRPSLSRKLCIVEIEILCLSVKM